MSVHMYVFMDVSIVYVCVGMHAVAYACGGQRTTCWNQFFPSIPCGSGGLNSGCQA